MVRGTKQWGKFSWRISIWDAWLRKYLMNTRGDHLAIQLSWAIMNPYCFQTHSILTAFKNTEITKLAVNVWYVFIQTQNQPRRANVLDWYDASELERPQSTSKPYSACIVSGFLIFLWQLILDLEPMVDTVRSTAEHITTTTTVRYILVHCGGSMLCFWMFELSLVQLQTIWPLPNGY